MDYGYERTLRQRAHVSEEAIMKRQDDNRWGRTDSAETPVVNVRQMTRTPLESPALSDLIVDFSGLQTPDLAGLTLLLTAQQLAKAERRQVWLKDLPERTWQLLQALGLDGLFVRMPSPSGPLN